MPKASKVPIPLPEWICRCIWRSTATNIIVSARDEQEAKDRAWKRVSRMEGGDMALEVKVIKQKEHHG